MYTGDVLTLAINTATRINAIALLEGGKILSESSWKSKSDETEKLLPSIDKLLKKKKKLLTDLEQIIVVRGPGSFSSVRIGITTANTLSMVLSCPIVSVATEVLMEAQLTTKADIVIHAGGRTISLWTQGKRTLMDKDDYKGNTAYTDFPETLNAEFKERVTLVPKRSLKSFGKALISIQSFKKNRIGSAVPEYLRPPNITPPKK